MKDLERHFYEPGSMGGEGSFNMTFPSGKDQVSRQDMQTTLTTGRPIDMNSGVLAGEDEPTVSADGLITYGGYTNILFNSGDISGVAWGVDPGVTITGTDRFTADSQYDDITQSKSTTEGVVYTISFVAHVPVGQLTGYGFRHANSATGNITNLTLTRVPTVHSTSFLGRVGDLAVSLGFIDQNTSNWVEVTITDFQVTETPYRMPYVQTVASAVTVPQNFSDADEGYKWPINGTDTPLLLDALDGVADGSELVTNGGFDTDITGWTENGVTTTISNGQVTIKSSDAGDNNRLEQEIAIVDGNNYEVSTIAKRGSSGVTQILRVGSYADSIITVDSTEFKTYKVRFIASSTADEFIRLYSTYNKSSSGVDEEVIIDNVSVKQISPAKGELELQWTPHYDYDASPDANSSIIDVNAAGMLWSKNTGVIYGYDGTSFPSVDPDFQADTKYTIKLIWGTHPVEGADHFQVIITDGTDTWSSTVTAFDGSFNPGDFLALAYDNPHPQTFKKIVVHPEPKNAGWL